MSEPSDDVVEDFDAVDQHEPSPDETAALAHYQQLEAKLRNGANWFYWIAGLSLVNSFILLVEGNWQFFVGLGITQAVTYVALAVGQQTPDALVICKIVAGVFTCFAAAIFATFGMGGRRRLSWVFICGMLLYALDGVLFLTIFDAIDLKSFAFHVFALFGIFGGFSASRHLKALDLELAEEGM